MHVTAWTFSCITSLIPVHLSSTWKVPLVTSDILTASLCSLSYLCFSYGTTAVKRRHDQGNPCKRKHLTGGRLTVSEGQSVNPSLVLLAL